MRIVAVAMCGALALLMLIALAAEAQARYLLITAFYAVLLIAAAIKKSRSPWPLTAVTAAGAFVVAALCTWSPIPNGSIGGLPLTDRLNYYFVFISSDIGQFYGVMEPGFLLVLSILRVAVPFPAAMAAIAVLVLAGYGFLASRFDRGSALLMALLVPLGYFAFWAGALNISRHFLAFGVVLFGIGLLIQRPRSFFSSIVIFGMAATVHASALIFLVSSVVDRLIVKRLHATAALWALYVSVFTANVLGLPPLSAVPGLSDRIARYTDISIEHVPFGMLDEVISNRNRIDFAAVLAVPAIVYVYLIIARARIDERLQRLVLFYTFAAGPYFLFSFLFQSDRLAYYGFALVPLVLIVQTNYMPRTWDRWALAGGLVIFSWVQFAFGIYGYSPRQLFIGVS